MRLERLDLVAFGHFTDHRLDFGRTGEGRDLHVVYGPNEAGKSTTLAAIEDLLFGMPRQSRWAFLHDYSVLEIGARLATERGGVELRRYKNRLADGEGNTLAADAIDTHRLDREAYRARFSLDEMTLEKGSDEILAQQGELGAALFSAAAGLADLGGRLARAMHAADAFYQPRKTKHIDLVGLKERIAEIDRALAERDVDTRAWAALRSETEAARERHARQQSVVAGLDGRVRALERRLRAHGAALRRRETLAQLEPFASLPELPGPTLAALEADLAEHARLRPGLDKLAELLAEHEKERATLVVDAEVLGQAETIDRLSAERERLAERRREEAQGREALDEAADRCRTLLRELGLDPARDPLETSVPETLLERLESLARERGALAAERDAAAREFAALDAERDEARTDAAAAEGGDDPLPDTTLLERYVGTLAERAPQVELETLARRHAEGEHALAAALDALGPWRGSAEALAAQAVPEPSELAALESEAAALGESGRALAEERRRLEAALATNAEARAELDPDALIDDRRLEALHAKRERALDALREAITDGHDRAVREGALAALEQALARLDEANAARLRHGDALARLAALERERERDARALERLGRERERHGKDAQAHAARVAALGERLGLAGLSLAGMLAWLPRREVALARREEARETGEALALARKGVARRAARLAELLAPLLPEPATETLARAPLEELLPLARERLEHVVRARDAASRARKAEMTQARAQERRRATLAEREAALAAWEARWRKACVDHPALGDEIETAIERLPLWRELARVAAALAGGRARLAALERRLDVFKAEVGDCLVRLGEHGPSEDPEAALIALERRLSDALDMHGRAGRLDARIADYRARLAEARAALAPSEQRLESLRERCAAEDLSALRDIAERVGRREALRGRLAECESDLREALGVAEHDGGDGGTAPEDPAGIDRDTLAVELDALRARLGAERHELDECLQLLRTGERELERLDDRALVAGLRAERANLLHEIETRALETLKLRLGRLALEAGLNRFRERHRSGMMEHARRAFVALTDGQFADLRALPDEKGRDRLVGVRSDGGVLETERMSTGTRFQLFLALRVAAWHEYADKRVPLPFVADDILESFDERRAAAALELMGEMARRGQVIYLTHHRHLVDLARERVGDLRVHELPARGADRGTGRGAAERASVAPLRRVT